VFSNTSLKTYKQCSLLILWHEDGCLLECCAVWSRRNLPMFQRSLLPLPSGRWVLIVLMKRRYISTRLHGAKIPEDSHLHATKLIGRIVYQWFQKSVPRNTEVPEGLQRVRKFHYNHRLCAAFKGTTAMLRGLLSIQLIRWRFNQNMETE
jgi:hypothetical protein